MKNKNALISIFMLVAILFGLVPQPVMAVSTCDWVQFVADITIPDGTTKLAGETFSKTWRVKNIGTCTWSTDYTFFPVSGEAMGGVATKLPNSVAPGATVDLTISLTAPAASGTYRGNWQLKNASGVQFGIGYAANMPFWVEIKVGSGSSGGTGYDFVANANAAGVVWSSGAGTLTFPGTEGDVKGFGIKLDSPKLENGTTDSAPGLLTVPQNVYNGYIQVKYPAFKVESGDRFKSIINCEYNATSCWVNFRLNYQIGDGAEQTFWSFNERYEGLYYPADRDLSSLAGKDVKFILYAGAAGYATGDRALWGAPRIVRGGGVIATNTPGPTPTTGPTKTPTVAPSTSDRVTFITDVNYPDGTVVAPNLAFKKTWRIKNTGTSTWTNKYSLVFVSGDKMGGADAILLTSTVGPNTSFDISVDLTSPAANGTYRGYWMLKNDKGATFGIGTSANKSWWVDVVVKAGVTPVVTNTPTVTATPTITTTPVPSGTTVFDFTAKPEDAIWTTGAGGLTFGGTDPSDSGFAQKLANAKLEDGSTASLATLLFVPQNVASGYIKAVYPAYLVQNGDHFKTTIGCQYGANSCYVKYVLDYQVDSEPVVNLFSYSERFEGLTRNIDINLSSMAGKNAKFVLTILAINATTGAVDRALWVAPRITH